MKILIVKPSSLGDVVQALPVARLLKRHRPQAAVYWCIEAGLAPLLEGDPDLAGIFAFPRTPWTRWPDLWHTVRAMREVGFDWVLDLQGLGRSAILAWLANGQTIIGLDNPSEGLREGAQAGYDLLAPASPPGTPPPERYLSALSILGVPADGKFEWLPVRRAIAAQVRQRSSNRPGWWVVLVPGARWDNKRWPAEYFAKTANRLASAVADLNLVILGSAADQALADVIVRACPQRCLNLAGQTSLPEMVEWVRLSRLVITNDTGPMHVAAALGKPLVALFGPTDPARTGPHGQLDAVLQVRDLPCVPCLRAKCAYREPLACLRRITPEQVCARALDQLNSDTIEK